MPRSRVRPSSAACHRRTAIRAGALGMLGLSLDQVEAIRAATGATSRRRRSVIYVFLSGGLAQHESFDPKPEGPLDIRGDFRAIPTRTPGLLVGEHLPLLANRSERWSLCRSLSHRSNDHSAGHLIMLTGRTELPAGFDPNRPKATDHPAIAALAGSLLPSAGVLPGAVVLPERIIHRTGRIIPGQFAGVLGRDHDPWFLDCSPYNPASYGAYPEYLFHHHNGPAAQPNLEFRSLDLAIPQSLAGERLGDRFALRELLDRQRAGIERTAEAESFERYRGMAASLLLDPAVSDAFDVIKADPALRERYGNNSFGWSLLLAARLVEAGVGLVQVNLGNNETWDTHESAWTNLSRHLLPPFDRALSALFDDLGDRGLFDDTLVVVAGEFGRSPKIKTLPGAREAGRDHWGRVQSVVLAGGGIRGGRVVGSTDVFGGEPASDPQRPEDLAATIYEALGLPLRTTWHDEIGRPFVLCEGRPIPGLT